MVEFEAAGSKFWEGGKPISSNSKFLRMGAASIVTLSYLCTALDMLRGLQEVQVPRIFRQSAHEDGKVVSPTHQPPLPPGDIPGTQFC